jgi:hypothetical protein
MERSRECSISFRCLAFATVPRIALDVKRTHRFFPRRCSVDTASCSLGRVVSDRTCLRSSLEEFRSIAGVDLQNCALRTHDDGTHGLCARSTVGAGDALVRVARSAVLSADGGSMNGWWYALVLRLLRERQLGVRSKWYEYIGNLPSEPPSVLWACETYGSLAVAEQLRPYGLAARVRRYWRFLRNVFETCKNDMPHGVQWRDFAWAASTVQNRAFRIDAHVTRHMAPLKETNDSAGTFGLLPGVDMLNHSVHVKTVLKLDDSSDEFYIVSGRTFSSGEDVLISYGPKTNEELLFFYGFVEGNNPADSIRVASQGILRRVLASRPYLTAFANEKAQMLQTLDLVDRSRDYDVNRDCVNREIMDILRICVANDEDLARLRARKQITSSISLENELSVWRCIEEECERQIAALPEVTDEAAAGARSLRKHHICSAPWDWKRAGYGATVAEALFVAEKCDILTITLERVRHFTKVSKAIGHVTTVLLPPTQSLVSATIYPGSAGDGNSGVHMFSLDMR